MTLTSNSRFLSLPCELRWRIYQMLFDDDIGVESSADTSNPADAPSIKVIGLPKNMLAISRAVSDDLAESKAARVATLKIHCNLHEASDIRARLESLLESLSCRYDCRLREIKVNQEGLYALDAVALSKFVHESLLVDVTLTDVSMHWDYRPSWFLDQAQGSGPVSSGCAASEAWSANGYVLKTLAGYFFVNHPNGHGGVDSIQRLAAVTRVRARQLTTFWKQRQIVAQVVSLQSFRRNLFVLLADFVPKREQCMKLQRTRRYCSNMRFRFTKGGRSIYFGPEPTSLVAFGLPAA